MALVTDLASERVESAAGDTHLLSMCMTRGEDMPRMCGEYWFLVPPVSSVLDKQKPDHQVRMRSLNTTNTVQYPRCCCWWTRSSTTPSRRS